MAPIRLPENQPLEVSHILQQHITNYRQQYSLWPEHKKIVTDLLNCRTAKLGGRLEQCDACGYESSITPAEIAIAPNASTCHGKDGFQKEKTISCRSLTFTLSLLCRMNSIPLF